ncbi:rap guanine nucleotide exchange factor 1 [Hydra vulgaris]|uniref:Rap guanine nucleotide exchange factor 1 n=1 Tax=Hydra vulgaris TaxID=6087 RepID=T2ME06_HYDVU|nr:rap guanine nucleotide exchange factor 1 [Hydra vulgaris]
MISNNKQDLSSTNRSTDHLKVNLVHVDGKVKRMQAFIKKIGKNRKTSLGDNEFDKGNHDEFEVIESKKEAKTQETLLLQYKKDVNSALTYYKAILKRGVVQKLPGTATAILESIINAENTIESCLEVLFRLKEFEPEKNKVSPLKVSLYRSITALIRLSDNVLFESYTHINIDTESANKAADNVLTSLECLYEFVLPKIRKSSLNEELMHCGTSSHSSLDALDNIPEKDNVDDSAFSDNDLSINHFGPSLKMPEKKGDPPPKPYLPNGNRNFYGNYDNTQLRKAISQPDEISSFKDDLNQVSGRPLSELQILDYGRRYSANNKSSSCKSSKSSISTTSNSSLGSPSKNNKYDTTDEDYAMNRRLEAFNKIEMNDSINKDEISMSSNLVKKIHKYSSRYEILAKSTLSLFNDEDDNNDSLDTSDDSIPPALPKKKTKHTADSYLTFVKGYDVIDYNERPSSYYDNLPVPNVHNITEDQFIKGDGLPKLPPKKGTYRNCVEPPQAFRTNEGTLKRQRHSIRESSAVYDEDNIPALDCHDVSKFLVFKEEENGPLLCGGTVDALIVYSTQVEDMLFYRAFLATYRTFVSPTELICKLLYRANRFQDKGNEETSKSVLRLLVKVMEEMYEELDKSLFDQLRSVVHRLLNLGQLKLAKDLRDKIVNYCIKLQVNHMPIYIPRKSDSELFDFKSFLLAQQMCVLDADYFIKIELPEVLRWGKEQSETLSPNLCRFIGHFNRMSFWVRTLILNEQRQQEREKIFKKFLKIMRILKRLNNFSAFLAILSALDSSPLRRLEWPKQYIELLAEDTKLIDSTSAFKTYRKALSEAKPPCIPYLGLILTDITFIHLGNPQDLPDGKVNFVKRWQQYNILDTVRRFKENLYDFSRDEKILDFFNEYEEHMEEEEMWEKSQQIRPRVR